ncbi:hypothetical protein ACFQZ1_23155 [Bacillus sp. CGMCC 1.60114]|uniref:hypothetical protein n=1 Tax=unclassified Bacillus (in: firmicutes) TaxID=185979 RepID=UPI0036439197
MGMKAPIDKCPHCSSNEGYYTKEQVYGTVRYKHNFDGREADNSSLHDHVSYKGGKVAYCIDCNKKLFNMSVL